MPYKLNVDLPAVNAGYDYAVSVSYTHLDVYKRQVYHLRDYKSRKEV